MKTKIIVICSAVLLTATAALHMGAEPKCLIRLGLIKKPTANKIVKAPAPLTSKTATVAAVK